MKAAIGFVYDNDIGVTERLELVITAESRTDHTLLLMFAQRTGRTMNEATTELRIAEPPAIASVEASGGARP